MLEAYRKFSYAPTTRRQLLAPAPTTRAPKIEHRRPGRITTLASFDRAERQVFSRVSLPQPRLAGARALGARSWAASIRRLNQIVINRQLDQPTFPIRGRLRSLPRDAPQKHPVRFVRCRRESHSAEFREEEKRFADYERAIKFLERFPTR